MKSESQIAIIGAGAIGSLLGGMLARNQENVTLVGNKAHVEAINKNGLMVDGAAGKFTVNPKAAEKLDFHPDIVFVSVKTQDVQKVCNEIQPYVNDVPVVMMQNGVISAEIAASFFKKEKIISCILLLNAQFLKPGSVTYVNKSPIVIGQAFSRNGESVKEIQSVLNKMARTEISDNILGAQWAKLFINAMGNGLDGMTGLSVGEYIKYPGLLKIGVLILKEALRLVDEAGIRLETLPSYPMHFFKWIIRAPTPIAVRLLKQIIRFKGDKEIITSTLQSLRKGKKTEIDYLNGEFVRLGRQTGIPAPFNSKVVELIHEIERTQKFYLPEDLVRIFRETAA